MLGCFGLTEPGSGSDAGSLQTTAVRKNGVYLLQGRKVYTTSASFASTFIVSAITNKSKGKKGISAFILERNFPGLFIAKKEEKMGLWASDTAGLILDSCKVPAENLLGKEGEGFRIFLQTLDAGRLGIAGWALGIAEAAFEASLHWAKEAGIEKNLIEEHEFEAGMLAEMSIEIEAGNLLAKEACQLKDAGKPYGKAFCFHHCRRNC
jgi:alkylation response protein AidB-like acyl-CoA dehydrogenase